ncbi:MAG TPA: ABC transporter permease, partial [Steroidobacteraceae bacterium]|nr:ABC transporter permease [Steroidobacteraceae bacterium]
MFHPLSVYVGLRYVRARSSKFFVSFITWASLVGVCVGVAALIVILSVMNGFESELRERLLSLSAQVRVSAASTPGARAASAPTAPEWQQAARQVAGVAGVADVAPYVELQALAVRQPEMLPVLLRGIDPQAAASVTELARAITQGHLSDLTAGSDRVIVGQVIAERLGLSPGDALTVLVPTVTADGAPAPKLREVTVAGVFEVGLQDHDATLVFAHLEDVRALSTAAAASEGLRVRVHDVLAAPQVAARLRAVLPRRFEVSDWTQDNANY